MRSVRLHEYVCMRSVSIQMCLHEECVSTREVCLYECMCMRSV